MYLRVVNHLKGRGPAVRRMLRSFASKFPMTQFGQFLVYLFIATKLSVNSRCYYHEMLQLLS